RLAVGSIAGFNTLMTVGYTVWALRGGSLLASLMTSLPVWQFVDPLPVIEDARRHKRKKKGDDIEEEDEQETKLAEMLD
ncbi:MAG: hypothetical protein CMJ18_15975, partial [Phycisphaeraceae bacterium]|nr:hypothetical protein [Phycisphaeraceae bacterium]